MKFGRYAGVSAWCKIGIWLVLWQVKSVELNVVETAGS